MNVGAQCALGMGESMGAGRGGAQPTESREPSDMKARVERVGGARGTRGGEAAGGLLGAREGPR